METEPVKPETDHGAPEAATPEEAGEPTAATEGEADLQQQLAEAQALAAENLDGWLRARAELANYKKRVERERAETYQNAAGTILARLLPALDDFERATKDAPDDPSLRQWVEGVTLIQRKLQTILESEGVQRIEAEGQQFDPNVHEALTHDESENHGEGEVIEVVRQGYRLGDRVLRPALVRVAK
jgi:molecular chaperone GrpE